MCELAFLIIAAVTIGRIAYADGQQAFIWGLVTVAICVALLYVPLPYVRIFIGFILAFGAMIGYKMLTNR